MFDSTKARFLKISLIVMPLWANFALADDGAQTMANAGSVGISVQPPAVPEPLPVGSPSPAVGESVATEAGQIPGVLREIGQRQTELTILELNLKRAELQKKLRDLETAAPANAPQFLPATAAQNAAPPMVSAESGWEPQTGPLVRRIHKIGGELVALVVFPGGETKNIRSGGLVGNGLRIVEILPDAVYVGKGGQQRYALPISQSRRGGF